MTGESLGVVHAYAVVAADFAGRLPPGLGGARVEVLPVAGLGVLISHLDAGGFGEDVWLANGTDPAWIERTARQHHGVLQAAIEQGDVLPLRLPGIYADARAVERALGGQADVLRPAFDRIRGRVEVGATAFASEGAEEPAPAPPASGRDYLMGRAAASTHREQRRDRRNAALVAGYERMSQSAASAVTNPPQDPALSGRREPMVLNAAFLVARADLDAFADLAEHVGAELWAEGVTLEVSGPWPPYNFVADAVAAPAEVAR